MLTGDDSEAGGYGPKRAVTQPVSKASAGGSQLSDSAKSRRSAQFAGSALQKMESLVPKLQKRDVANMQPDERDAVIEEAERLTIEWIHAFLDEVYRIDDFFKTKQTELINSFIGLQDKFRIKTEKYEVGSTKTSRKKGKRGTEVLNSTASANES